MPLLSFPDLTERLIERLEGVVAGHPSVRADTIDISRLSALDLGRLWPALQRHGRRYDDHEKHDLAQSILDQAAQLGMAPALDADSAVALFRDVVGWDDAVEYLAYLACDPPDALIDELRRVFERAGGADGDKQTDETIAVYWARYRYQSYALASRIGEDAVARLASAVQVHLAGSPFALQEYALVSQLSPAAQLAMAGAGHGYYWPGEESAKADAAAALADEPAYVAFAEQALTAAAKEIADLHAGRLPYVADRAFTVDDAHVLARAARVAALRDAPWFGALIGKLLCGVCVAPTAAASVPSQSLAIALGHSIEGVPTPESIQALRDALATVRHAGVKKKLQRNQKPAERALAARPDMALRLGATLSVGKRQQAMLASCLEAGYWQGLDLSLDDWRASLLECGAGGPMSRALIWLARSDTAAPFAFLPVMRDGKTSFVDQCGKPCELPGSARIALWHPLDADESERVAWRALLAERRLRQPLRQGYREYYERSGEDLAGHGSEVFANHLLSLRPLIGLARREGWRIDGNDSALVRRFGSYRVSLGVDARLYPGAFGWGESGALTFERRHRAAWRPSLLGDLPTALYSEACRAADLLVSVSAFALGQESGAEAPPNALLDAACQRRKQRLAHLGLLAIDDLGQMARMRREALRYVFAEQIAAGRLRIDNRYVRVDEHAVHLATGRVTRDGEQVEMPAANAALAGVPWLPYDEALLEKIAHAVGELLRARADN